MPQGGREGQGEGLGRSWGVGQVEEAGGFEEEEQPWHSSALERCGVKNQ